MQQVLSVASVFLYATTLASLWWSTATKTRATLALLAVVTATAAHLHCRGYGYAYYKTQRFVGRLIGIVVIQRLPRLTPLAKIHRYHRLKQHPAQQRPRHGTQSHRESLCPTQSVHIVWLCATVWAVGFICYVLLG